MWIRELLTASSAGKPKSMSLMSTWSMQVRMRFDPPEPTAMAVSPRLATAGAIIDEMRVLGVHL